MGVSLRTRRGVPTICSAFFAAAVFSWSQSYPALAADARPGASSDKKVVDANVVDRLRRWKDAVRISPVSPGEHHSIHTYYLTCPESPDGRWILYFASKTAESHEGEIRIRERTTGKEKVLARNVRTEDAHRAACQQWICNGSQVAFHNVVDDEWIIEAVDIASGDRRVLARGWQIGFGQPTGNIIPLYGPHWDPEAPRDVVMLDVATGTITKTDLTAKLLKDTYPEWVEKMYGDRPISVFFPVLSPDLSRIMCKCASPAGGDYRSKKASDRYGVFWYDRDQERFLAMHPKWGHPAWHPDSRHVLEVGGLVFDSDTAKYTRVANFPKLRGSHPSFSPDGILFVSDSIASNDVFGGTSNLEWGVVVGDPTTGEVVPLCHFDNSRGARSWRRSHPHPIFSADGQRIYFNQSDGKWTRLHVAAIE